MHDFYPPPNAFISFGYDGCVGHKHGSLTQQREQADNWRAGKCNGYGVLLPCRCQCGAVGIKPLQKRVTR